MESRVSACQRRTIAPSGSGGGGGSLIGRDTLTDQREYAGLVEQRLETVFDEGGRGAVLFTHFTHCATKPTSAHLGPTAAHTRRHTRWHTPRTSSIDRPGRRHGTERSGSRVGSARRGAERRTDGREGTDRRRPERGREKRGPGLHARGVSSVSPRDGTRARSRSRRRGRAPRPRYVGALCAWLRAGTIEKSHRRRERETGVACRGGEALRPFALAEPLTTSSTSLPRTISISLKRLYGRARADPFPMPVLFLSLCLWAR